MTQSMFQLLVAPRGRGPCVAISGEQPYPGCSRWEAASGSFPGSPRALDCGNIATGGGGPRGGGTRSPSPVSYAPRTLNISPTLSGFLVDGCPRNSPPPTPPAPPAGRLPTRFCRGTPTPPAPSALLPRPQRGAGAVRGDIRGTAVPGAMPGVQPCSGLLRDLPMCWTVEISPRGEGPTGRGNSFPLPCLPHSNHLTSRRHPLPAPPAG